MEFDVQGFASTAWSLAVLNHRDEKLFTAFARSAERRLSQIGRAEKDRDEKLVQSLMKRAERQLSEFDDPNLPDAPLAQDSEYLRGTFNARTLRMTLWALLLCERH
eukprot:gnl/TRDRNA2_/TRDRNA2_174294_c13_seq1.p1 gnl/TRDRNA2_/TRDRNA2_174294_c13~~gnl/TRDRNA2_/TRDRNA2_174294_c13_seq1.p1  ORF type:complete len:106 (-),score=19.44 gnl/TRDRNA2_/TRDRNA2_174294_c13_seq1:3-320(-)